MIIHILQMHQNVKIVSVYIVNVQFLKVQIDKCVCSYCQHQLKQAGAEVSTPLNLEILRFRDFEI